MIKGLCPDCLEVLVPSLDALECSECHRLWVEEDGKLVQFIVPEAPTPREVPNLPPPEGMSAVLTQPTHDPPLEESYMELLNKMPLEAISNEVIRDIVQRYRFVGRLSAKQQDLVLHHIKAQTAPPLKRGRQVLQGNIVNVKRPDVTELPTHLRIRLPDENVIYVKLNPDEQELGWNVGDAVLFEGQVQPAPEDPHFGFTRMSKVRRLTP